MKSTALSVEQGLASALTSFKEQASAVKKAHDTARKQIREDVKMSDLGKRERLDALKQQTSSKLAGIKAEQESYIKTCATRSSASCEAISPRTRRLCCSVVMPQIECGRSPTSARRWRFSGTR